ncbi:MAG: hypothetical protein MJY82_01975 [Fibrobacter sp.]|nr:hypothetical protein [Fibrobacter sp.]
MKIEKRIVVDSKWSTAKRVAVAAAVGVSVCLPLSACNDDDSSPVAPASQVEESSPSTELLSSAEVAPQSSAEVAPQSSTETAPESSAEQAPASSSSETSPIVDPDVIAPWAGDPIVGPDDIDSLSSSSVAPESSGSVEILPVVVPIVDTTQTKLPEINRDDYPLHSMASPIGHIQIPLINV